MDSVDEAIKPIIWKEDCLHLLDQRILPHQESYIRYDNLKNAADAITDMVVRGAPAIGITAAYAIALAVKKHVQLDSTNWKDNIEPDLAYLAKARPTAVNLHWAIARMRDLFGTELDKPYQQTLELAIKIHQQDIENNRLMGQAGAALMKLSDTRKFSVVTHCNAGALATGGYGTALGVIRSAWQEGVIDHVYADETRPWLQGARLTAWELVKENIPVSLMVEGAAASIMENSQKTDSPVRWIIVGSDRIAGNGDVANKIGTYNLAIIAKHLGIKFMVVAPISTIDFDMKSGDLIPIEERSLSEVTMINEKQISPLQAGARNPAFDVTPSALVDAIVTEKGVLEKPDWDKIQKLR